MDYYRKSNYSKASDATEEFLIDRKNAETLHRECKLENPQRRELSLC